MRVGEYDGKFGLSYFYKYKNHITISISTYLYRAAFNKRTVLNALSKLMYIAAWLCNQCFLQSALVEFGVVIYNDFEVVSQNWRKWLE